jgi:hypothetical protein
MPTRREFSLILLPKSCAGATFNTTVIEGQIVLKASKVKIINDFNNTVLNQQKLQLCLTTKVELTVAMP